MGSSTKHNALILVLLSLSYAYHIESEEYSYVNEIIWSNLESAILPTKSNILLYILIYGKKKKKTKKALNSQGLENKGSFLLGNESSVHKILRYSSMLDETPKLYKQQLYPI